MRLYLSADSQNNTGYTPDCLKVIYEENGQDFELTLDICGEVDYSTDCLDCRCKGDLIPWILHNLENGEEIELYELPEEECYELFPINKIANIICNSKYYTVDLFPINEDDADYDVLTNCKGYIEIYDGLHNYEHHFEFEAEPNIY